jgi:NAD(P)-dependent dehydrogenase (short-subunit alcohol dehydrogenase family)
VRAARPSSPKIVLITGASSGLGAASAAYLSKRGYRVYAASRRGAADGLGDAVPVRMDVDDQASVREGVNGIAEREGRIDVVVNCAGFGVAGAIEDTPVDAARAQFETNFFGVLRVCHRVLPLMRRERSGLIVNVGSIGGVLALPFQGIYSATKFALEGLSEALSAEVRQFGIRVVLVRAGDFRTGFTAARRCVTPTGSPYAERFRRALEVAESDESNGSDPQRLARLLEHVIRSPHPRFLYGIGPFHEVLLLKLQRVLPSRTCRWLIARHYGAT